MMKERHRAAVKDAWGEFGRNRVGYQNWEPIFHRLGLKPRRFFHESDAIYVCSAEGWFRLSLVKYNKEELTWLRRVLEYLEERSFNNWAVSWRKTIIWEESDCCYLIQPWLISRDCFNRDDPAALGRIAEILADLYRCGKEYRDNRGLAGMRDRWSTVQQQWNMELKELQGLDEGRFHEKIRKEFLGIRKSAETALEESLKIWETGMSSLFEHHNHLGVLGHGQFLTRNIVWRKTDYYLLNWEHISFQPKIVDLTSLIIDSSQWEPEWILFLINRYSKLQPLWPEEYQALKAMLHYPKKVLELLRSELPEEVGHKLIKEAEKELRRKGRCLEKVWQELSAEKTRWSWGREYPATKLRESGKISMVLSPVATWGDSLSNPDNSLIQVKHDHKLPSDIWKRLVNGEEDRVLGGREGGIMEAAAQHFANDFDGDEEADRKPPEGRVDIFPGAEMDQSLNPELEKVGVKVLGPGLEKANPETNVSTQPETIVNPVPEKDVLNWRQFPQPCKRGKNH
jgi:exonuclease VII small subunit